jgi:hypothetical protein
MGFLNLITYKQAHVGVGANGAASNSEALALKVEGWGE